jgi:hypothetical protein
LRWDREFDVPFYSANSVAIKEEIFDRLSRSGKIRTLLVDESELVLFATLPNVEILMVPLVCEILTASDRTLLKIDERDLTIPNYTEDERSVIFEHPEMTREAWLEEGLKESPLSKNIAVNVYPSENLNSTSISNNRKRIERSENSSYATHSCGIGENGVSN